MALYANYSRKARCLALLFDLVSWPVRLFRRKTSPSKIEKILVVRPDHLGDLLMTIDALYTLKQEYSESRLIMITPDWNLPIADKLEFIDEILPVRLRWLCLNREKPTPFLRILSMIRKLRKERIDLFIDFRGDFRLVLLFGFLTGCKIRRGFSNLGGRYLLSDHILFERGIHFHQQNFALISRYTDKKLSYRISPDSSDKRKAKEFLEKYGLTPGSFVIIHPSVAGYWKVKRWPASCFIETARHIISNHKLGIVICSGPAETDIGDSVAREIPGAVNMSGKLSLLEFAAILKQARFLISNDSAPMHLAANLGIPLIAVFGPTDYRRSGPYPPHEHRITLEGNPKFKRPLFGAHSLDEEYFPPLSRVVAEIDRLITSLE